MKGSNRKASALPHWVLVLLTLALVAGACGGGNDDDGSAGAEALQPTAAATAPEPADTGSESEPAPTESDPDEPASAPTQEEAAEAEAPAPEEAPEATPEPIVLTDSFRGVTSEAILIGHSSIDFEKLNADFGLDLPYQNFGPPFLALVDWYNEQGGVLGRRLEVVLCPYFWPVRVNTATFTCGPRRQNSST